MTGGKASKFGGRLQEGDIGDGKWTEGDLVFNYSEREELWGHLWREIEVFSRRFPRNGNILAAIWQEGLQPANRQLRIRKGCEKGLRLLASDMMHKLSEVLDSGIEQSR